MLILRSAGAPERRPYSKPIEVLMFGMKALPYIGDLARKVDTAAPSASMVLKTAPHTSPRLWRSGFESRREFWLRLNGSQGGSICSEHGEYYS